MPSVGAAQVLGCQPPRKRRMMGRQERTQIILVPSLEALGPGEDNIWMITWDTQHTQKVPVTQLTGIPGKMF